jgi:hypothetical protein
LGQVRRRTAETPVGFIRRLVFLEVAHCKPERIDEWLPPPEVPGLAETPFANAALKSRFRLKKLRGPRLF